MGVFVLLVICGALLGDCVCWFACVGYDCVW